MTILSVITLLLLQPLQLAPIQTWTFEDKPIIRIGRAKDNHVVLYSAVVSRHHVELHQVNKNWEFINKSANGTYLDGQCLSQGQLTDGTIFCLAPSGPKLQFRLGQFGAL